MRIGEVIGRLTLSRMHPALKQPRFLIVSPLTRQALVEGLPDRGEDLVVYDELAPGLGALIGFSEGREAANPFGKTKTPIDAYNACLIDQISIR